MSFLTLCSYTLLNSLSGNGLEGFYRYILYFKEMGVGRTIAIGVLLSYNGTFSPVLTRNLILIHIFPHKLSPCFIF